MMDINIGMIITIKILFILMLFNAAKSGNNRAGTVNEPIAYQISIAYSKSIANTIENKVVMPNPHFV